LQFEKSTTTSVVCHDIGKKKFKKHQTTKQLFLWLDNFEKPIY
jgi:hypothetical protein